MPVRSIYVIGPPRSGTTLTLFLLSGAGSTLAISEPFLMHSVFPHWVFHRRWSRFQHRAGLTRVPPPRACSRSRYQEFLREMADRNGLRYLAMKETFRDGDLSPQWRNTELMNEIAAGPDPAVALIRHPHDTVASSLRLFRWSLGLPGWLIRRRWPSVPRFGGRDGIVCWAAANYAQYAAWVHHAGVKIVRYESLVAEPAVQLRQICEHLDMPFDDRMLTPHPRRTFDGLGAPELLFRKPKAVHGASVGRGRELSPRHRDLVSAHCLAAADVFGYDL